MLTQQQLRAQGRQIARELHAAVMRAHQPYIDELSPINRKAYLNERIFPAVYDELNRQRGDEVTTLSGLHTRALTQSYEERDAILRTIGDVALSNPPTETELAQVASEFMALLLDAYHSSDAINDARAEIPTQVNKLRDLLISAKRQYTTLLNALHTEQVDPDIDKPGRAEQVRRRLPLTSAKKTKRLESIQRAEKRLKKAQDNLIQAVNDFHPLSAQAIGPEFRATILQLDRLTAYTRDAIADYRNATPDDATDQHRRQAAFRNFVTQRDRINVDLVIGGQDANERVYVAFDEMRDRVREKYQAVLRSDANKQEIIRVLRELDLHNIAARDAAQEHQAVAALQAVYARISQQVQDELVADAKVKGKAAMAEYKVICDDEGRALAQALQERAMRKYHPSARIEADGNNLAVLSSGPRSINPALGDHVEIDSTTKFTRIRDKTTGQVNETISIKSLPSNREQRMQKLLKAADLWSHGLQKKAVKLGGVAASQDPSGKSFDRNFGMFTFGFVGYQATKPKSHRLHAAEAAAVLEYHGVQVSGFVPHSTAEKDAYDKARDWVKQYYAQKVDRGLAKIARDPDTVSDENLDPNLRIGRRRTDFRGT